MNDEFQKDGSSTPQWLFDVLDDQVRALTGQCFQLDAAASDWNAKCKFYFDKRSDALQQDWSNWPTIFCNPPFSADLIPQFVAQGLHAAERGSTVVFILPFWQRYPWFQELKRRGQMQDIITIVNFERPDGSKFVLNKGKGTSLVAVTLGPKVVPGSNGEPIAKPHQTVPRFSAITPAPTGVERPITDPPVLTSYKSNNDFLLAQVASLYFRPGDRIADVTFGTGRFWCKLDLTQYDFHASDLLTVPEHPYDFRCLPYRCDDFNVHVFDPPYMHNPPTQRYMDADYRNYDTTKGFSHDDIIQLYRDGMVEGHRILKPGGLMLIKCKDEMENGRQRMSHIEIHGIAVNELGMDVQDLFIVTPPRLLLRFRHNGHARKNHSYLWVFRKQSS